MKYATNTGQFVALIPARGGSKGVPGKNIKLLGGFPLLAYTIAVCQMSSEIDRVVVSTDDAEIAKIARRYGAEVPFLRPSEYAQDNSTDYEFVNHAIHWFIENEGTVAEYLVHMRPTTPLREPDIVDSALRQFRDNVCFTSLRSAHKAPESPYKWFLKSGNGTFSPLARGLDNEAANAGREGFPTTYIPDGYVDVLRSRNVMENGVLHGEMMMAFESPVCVEVDTLEEFNFLEYLVRKRGGTVYNYLREKSVGISV